MVGVVGGVRGLSVMGNKIMGNKIFFFMKT